MNKAFLLALSGLGLVVLTTVSLMWSADTATVHRTPPSSASTAVKQAHSDQGGLLPWDRADTPRPLDAPTLNLPLRPDGKLQVSPDTRATLDNWLADHPNATPEIQAERFQEALPASLPDTARAEALDLMTRYAHYQQALRQLQQGQPGLDESLLASLRVQQTTSLRAQYLGEGYKQAMFGLEEQVQAYELARLQIETTHGWSDAQRQAALNALAQQYPRDVLVAAERGKP